jgi:hypothetical protein
MLIRPIYGFNMIIVDDGLISSIRCVLGTVFSDYKFSNIKGMPIIKEKIMIYSMQIR